MSVVKPQSFPAPQGTLSVVNPTFSRAHNPSVFRGGLPQFWFAPEGDPDPNPPQLSKAEIEAAIDRKIAEFRDSKKAQGDDAAALRLAVTSAYAQEQRAKDAERELNELKAKAPDEAALKALDELKELGGLEAVKKRLEDGNTVIQERDNLAREKVVNEASALLKVKPSALSAKWLGEGVPLIEGEGDDAKVFIVEGDKKTLWDDFVKANGELADVLPALQLTGENGRVLVPKMHGGNSKAPPPDDNAARKGQEPLYSSL